MLFESEKRYRQVLDRDCEGKEVQVRLKLTLDIPKERRGTFAPESEHLYTSTQTSIILAFSRRRTTGIMSLDPERERLRALDTLRTRLGQLSETLSLIHRDLTTKDPLPSWPQLESLQASLAFALSQLNDTMTRPEYSKVLKSAHVYPLPTFPGHKEGATLMTLLRKKLDTAPEEWIEEFTEGFKGDGGEGLEREEMDELWNWAGGCSGGIVGPMLENDDFGDDFTLAEREAGVKSVRTGLRRKLWEEESGDEEEDEGERMEEDVMPVKEAVEREEGVDPLRKPLPLDTVLRFATTGLMPSMPNR